MKTIDVLSPSGIIEINSKKIKYEFKSNTSVEFVWCTINTATHVLEMFIGWPKIYYKI